MTHPGTTGPAPGFRSGFVVLAGRPNVGKSTLLNRLVGHKVAITSDKPQTTRNRIAGVVHREGAQIVFLDTPGLHAPRHRLGEFMVGVARATLGEVDVVCFVVDADRPPGEADRTVADVIASAGRRSPTLLVVNKIDRIDRDVLVERLAGYAELGDFRHVVPVSAATGENCERLVELLVAELPEGPQYYPPGAYTDQPEQVLVAELVREQVLRRTRDEVPHSVAVRVDRWVERPGPLAHVAATIYVERESQKGILIGRNGRMLKDIGTDARQEAEALLGMRLFLELWVKVAKDWRDRPAALRQLGYREE